MSANDEPADSTAADSKSTTSLWRQCTRFVMRIVIAVFAVACVVVAVRILWSNHAGRNAALRTLSELETRGIQLESRDTVDPQDNGAEIYKAAFLAFGGPDALRHRLPIVGSKVAVPEIGEPIPEDMRPALREAVDYNQPAILLMRRAENYDHFRFGNTSQLPPLVPMWLGGSRHATHWQRVLALAADADGNPALALEHLRSVIHLSQAMRDDPEPLVLLVRASIAASMRDGIMLLLGRRELTEAQLLSTAELLRVERKSYDALSMFEKLLAVHAREMVDPTFRDHNALQVRHRRDRFLREAEAGADPSPFKGESGWSWVGQSLRDTWATWCFGDHQRHKARIINEVLPFIDELSRKDADVIALSARVKNAFEDSERANFATILRTTLDCQSYILVAEVAMHVEVFRLRNGRWPTSLDELPAGTPIDPWGMPIRMKTTKTGRVIYTTGKNRIDDDGNDSVSGVEGADDWPFELLNPELRGRLVVPVDPDPSSDE